MQLYPPPYPKSLTKHHSMSPAPYFSLPSPSASNSPSHPRSQKYTFAVVHGKHPISVPSASAVWDHAANSASRLKRVESGGRLYHVVESDERSRVARSAPSGGSRGGGRVR